MIKAMNFLSQDLVSSSYIAHLVTGGPMCGDTALLCGLTYVEYAPATELSHFLALYDDISMDNLIKFLSSSIVHAKSRIMYNEDGSFAGNRYVSPKLTNADRLRVKMTLKRTVNEVHHWVPLVVAYLRVMSNLMNGYGRVYGEKFWVQVLRALDDSDVDTTRRSRDDDIFYRDVRVFRTFKNTLHWRPPQFF